MRISRRALLYTGLGTPRTLTTPRVVVRHRSYALRAGVLPWSVWGAARGLRAPCIYNGAQSSNVLFTHPKYF